jgi:hypothetical protein
MRIRSVVLVLFNVFLSSTLLYASQDNVFKQNNPDGMKYDFARSFIIGFGYLNSVDQRFEKSKEIKAKGNEMAFIQWNLDRLAKDNMDLRIAKNYVTKYFNVPNRLMRKVIDSYAYACDGLIGLNLKERELWNQMHQVKKKGDVSAEQDQEFVKSQEKLADHRKVVMRSIVEVSVLMTKVLFSEDVQEKQVKKRLALTLKERDNLIRKLDTFAGDNLDWGIKPGQTYVHGAEATIREVLEDPTYLSADE